MDDVDEILLHQNNKCLICQAELDSKSRRHIDHCHTTGAVRGILCSTCNKGLGQFKDNPKLLRRAAKYLEKQMKIYEVTFSFLDPAKAVGKVIANSPEEAVEKITADITQHSPYVQDFEVLSVTEVAEISDELSPERTLN